MTMHENERKQDKKRHGKHIQKAKVIGNIFMVLTQMDKVMDKDFTSPWDPHESASYLIELGLKGCV